MTPTRRTRRSIRDERGQSLVEFALVLPVLCLLIFGILEFGVAFNNYLTLTDSVRVGARKAAVSRASGDPCGDVRAAITANRGGLDSALLVIPCPTSSWVGGEPVTVTAEYPVNINVIGRVVYAGTMTSSATERVE